MRPRKLSAGLILDWGKALMDDLGADDLEHEELMTAEGNVACRKKQQMVFVKLLERKGGLASATSSLSAVKVKVQSRHGTRPIPLGARY